MRDLVKDAFVAGYEACLKDNAIAICSLCWINEAWTEYAAARLERIADDQDELDEPIPYRPTDVYVHATHEPADFEPHNPHAM